MANSPSNKNKRLSLNSRQRYTPAIGIVIGAGLGIVFGALFWDLSWSIIIGAALGLVVGAVLATSRG